ncbi:hypothetical protein [Sphingobacterium psychroaquaticum]|uniref:Uncharacterized protein n=1 Tax=Sphingobacterium psychroaquaticum TaxID=561061 RepID=A0A1X7IN97_9SPHI|nr:hypothetical protein [Sphingobacterium psychroaquaticum]SMG16474.1 hypothetical protein SAMN05660862_1076 [Sphingobacterium psychroaquaticum]
MQSWKKKESTLKGIIIAFAILSLVTLIVGIYLTVSQKKFNAVLSAGISINVFYIIFSTQLSALKKEKKSRGL